MQIVSEDEYNEAKKRQAVVIAACRVIRRAVVILNAAPIASDQIEHFENAVDEAVANLLHDADTWSDIIERYENQDDDQEYDDADYRYELKRDREDM